MVSELRLAKGMMKTTTSLKKSLKQCSMVASHLKQSIKALWNLLLSIENSMTKTSTKDEGLISTLTNTFEDENIWVIDSGASRYMKSEHKQLRTLSRGKSSYSVELGDKKNNHVRGIGSTSLELENKGNIHLNNILFVPGLQKNLLSISCLENKGAKVVFIDGKVVVWDKNSSIENAKMIGIREGRLYGLLTPPSQDLVHIEVSPCELWHRRLGHLHYIILPTLNSMVNGIPEHDEDQ